MKKANDRGDKNPQILLRIWTININYNYNHWNKTHPKLIDAHRMNERHDLTFTFTVP